MADYLNYLVPVPNPDENGNNNIVAVRAGKPSSFSKPITMYAPINMNGLFLYNVLGDSSLSYYSYGNATVVPAAGAFRPAIPNGGLFVLETPASTGSFLDTFVDNGATIGTFRQHTGGATKLAYWIEFQAISTTADGTGNADNVRVGLIDADTADNAYADPAQPAVANQSPDYQVDAYGTDDANLTTRVFRGILNAAVATDRFFILKAQNMTSAVRPVLIKNLKVIVSAQTPLPV